MPVWKRATRPAQPVHGAPGLHGKHPDDEDNDGASLPEIDEALEKALVRKLDWWICPMVMLLYLLNNLDRVNIGNARLYGMEQDLDLYGNRYQLAVSILFVTYEFSGIPSNLALKKVRPSRWIAFIATAWGVIATLTGVVQSYGGLIVARLFLGLVEGGLFPSMTVYLTMFYTRREIALRVGYLFVSSALSGAFGGLLAYGIGYMDGVAGLRGWRWILIIEGLPSVVLGVSCWWLLADDYGSAWYLKPEEKELMRLRFARQQGMTTSAEQFSWADVRKATKDWKIWVFCLGQAGMDTMLYGYSTFLPTIIQDINPGWSRSLVQVFTIPCYALGAIAYLSTAWVSDKTQRRGVYAVAAGIVSMVGYAVLLSDVASGVHYFGCFLVACGLYVSVGVPIAWLATNNPRFGKRTTATGIQLVIGNLAGIWAPFLYQTNQGPRYTTGHATTLALVGFAACIYAFFWAYFAKRNAKRRAGAEDARVAGQSSDEIRELGDENPEFMFAY